MPSPRASSPASCVVLALAALAPRALAQDDAAARAITIADASANAFGFPSPLLSAVERRAFAVGNSFFKQNWIQAPASAAGRDGLGPLFNARSCSACHLHDGRSAPPGPDDADRSGLLVRIGVRDPAGGPDRPHPLYGGQIQDNAILGVQPEARVAIEYEPVPGAYGDGTTFTLQRPRYTLAELAYGPLGDGVVLGARTAPQLIGLGLLEAIPTATLQAWADPDDRDGDGVSGRVHWLGSGEHALPGRFGWKATQPTVEAQTAAAFVHDIGITSAAFPHEPLTDAERERIAPAVRGAASAVSTVEIAAATFERVVFYTCALAVPAPRDQDAPQVAEGRALFTRFHCAVCHVPSCTTGATAFHPHFSNQSIAPFTDLLLHDLGDELADGKRDGDAATAEWRTPPLWGVGLVPIVNGHSRYLHDGRARDLAEAVLWHGGEAHRARERFRTATAAERDALLAFVRSL